MFLINKSCGYYYNSNIISIAFNANITFKIAETTCKQLVLTVGKA